MKKLFVLIFAGINFSLFAHLSEIDELMRKAFWDSKQSIASTASFQQKDKHKRKVSVGKNDYTITVEFDYKTAPKEIKETAEKTIKAEEDAATKNNKSFWKSALPAEIHALLALDSNTRTQCTLHWKRTKEDESKIECTFTATFAELSKASHSKKNA